MKQKYSQSEIKTFRKKDMRILIEVLIKADGQRNEGSGKKLNREEIKADLIWALALEDEMVDAIIREENEKAVKENDKKQETKPF